MNHPASLSSMPRLDGSGPLHRRIAAVVPLSTAESSLLQDIEARGYSIPAQTVLRAESGAGLPQVLLAGWACYRRLLKDGRQQIIRFLVPGDVIGSIFHPDGPSRFDALSLTPIVVADARPLRAMLAEPGDDLAGIADAFLSLEHAEQASIVDQIVRLGRQTAYERFLHLMLEFHFRLGVVGQVNGNTFGAPLTQEILSDALGLSVVHVNRVLQQIRRDGLLTMQKGEVTLLEPARIKQLADWSGRAMAASPSRLTAANAWSRAARPTADGALAV